MSEDEYTDILGADTLPIGPKKAGFWAGLPFILKSGFLLVFLLASYIVFVRLWDSFMKWREKQYKLSVRRKYGIPDHDHRPFNVAYAAVQLAREQEDKKRTRRPYTSPAAPVSTALDQRSTPLEPIRQRSAQRPNGSTLNFPGQYRPASNDNIPSISSSHLHNNPNRVTFADGYNTSASPLDLHAELSSVPSSSSPRRTDRKSLGILKSSYHNGDPRRKRAIGDEYDQSDDDVDPKKTRVEGDEFIDGDEEPGWEDEYGRSTSRGSKREYSEDDTRTRDKRQRKVSADAVDMDVDEEADQVGELAHIPSFRGKKRDRAEAGSTFGGDDDENVEQEAEEYGSKSRHRKRRNKRRSDANSEASSSRGRKRDRDIDDEMNGFSDSDEVSPGATSHHRGSKKKRGKKGQRYEDEKDSDVSMDDSQSARTKGRQIGEEWMSNGIKYKLGEKGQRLRETLLKKAKQMFLMPEDSVHPDRSAVHDVYIEAWLTDEQYQEAANQGILYQTPREIETPSPTDSATSTPPLKGKHLLWESSSGHSPMPQPANPFETSPRKASGGNNASALIVRTTTPVSPFPRNGRIASALRGPVTSDASSAPPSPSLVDSTNSLSNSRGRRQYSKWEKQDLEAKAMMRVREANNKKKEEEEKIAREKREKEVKAAAPAIPTISFTKPPEEQSKKEEASKTPAPSLSLPTPGTATPAIGAPKFNSGTPIPSAPASASNEDKSKSLAPSFSFAPPSSTSSTPAATTSTPKPPSFSTHSSTPAATVNPSAPPSLSFGPSSTTAAPKPQGAPQLGLGFPSLSPGPASTPSTSPMPASNGTTAPKFSFGPSTASTPAPSATAPSNGSSLLPRMNPSPGLPAKPQESAPSSTSAAPTFSFAKSAAEPSSAPAPPKFSFAKPSTPTPASASATQSSAPSAFGFAKPAESNPPAATSASTGTPKFSFGTPSPTPQPSTGNNGASAPTTAAPKFGFGNPNTSSTTPAPVESSGSPSTAPKFSFGNPSGVSSSTAPSATQSKSPFGAPASFSGGASTAPTSSPFSGFGVKTNTAGSDQQPKSVFGATSTPSPFGAPSGSNNFGSNNSTATAASTPDTTSMSTATPSQQAMTSVFGQPSSSGGSGQTGAFSFGSQTQNKDSTVGSATTSSSSPFGTSAFGKPASSTPAAASTNVFGNTSSMGEKSTAASTSTLAPSPFAAFGGASGSTGSSNVFGTPSKPAGGETSKFSFGAPAGGSTTPSTPTPAHGEAPKSAFSFGGSSAAPSTKPNLTTSSSFSFGSNTASGGSTGGGAFSFGSGSAGGSTTPQSSPFGGPGLTPNPNPFGAAGTKSNSFTFGSSSSTTNGEQSK